MHNEVSHPREGARPYLSRLERGRGPDPPPRIPPFLPDRSFSTRATFPVRAASSSSWSFPIVSQRLPQSPFPPGSSSPPTPHSPKSRALPAPPKKMQALQPEAIPQPRAGTLALSAASGCSFYNGAPTISRERGRPSATRPHSHSPQFPRPRFRGWGVRGGDRAGEGGGAFEGREEGGED